MGEQGSRRRPRALRAAVTVATAAMAVALLSGCEEIYPVEDGRSPSEPADGSGGPGGGGPDDIADQPKTYVCEDSDGGDNHPPGEGQAPPTQGAGEGYRYANGLRVAVGGAEPYTPSEGADQGERVYRLLVSVHNCGHDINEADFAFQGWAAGIAAGQLHDPALTTDPPGVLEPGESFERYVVFDVPVGPDLLNVVVEPLPAGLEHSYWALPL
jgi:hypothetical protein